MESFIFLIAICIFILFANFNNAKKDIKNFKRLFEENFEENARLKAEIEAIKARLKGGNFTDMPVVSQKIKPVTVLENVIVPEEIQKPIEPVVETTIVAEEILNPVETTIVASEIVAQEATKPKKPVPVYHVQDAPRAVPVPKATPVPKPESAFSVFLKKFEQQFADNWTGILGTAIMVLGIGYLSIYTATQVGAFYRILILWLYSGLLIGSYYFLHKKEKWNKTGLWLRSAGASLFLFSCFGASQIEALKCIDNDYLAYGLIAFGISLNLYFGYIIKKQTFLSLHVVLSILILCVVPDKLLITFVLACATSTAGILLSYKEKWEYHLLIVILAFLIFDIWWNSDGVVLSHTQNIFAIIGIITVFASCMIMQYRSVYENTHFEKSAFITHLTNWVLFAIGLLLHSTGSRFKIFVLFAGAVICFFLAIRARKRKIFWLYHLDGMISFVLATLTIILLNDWNIGRDVIALLLYVMTLSCLFVAYKEKETLLHKIFLALNHVLVFAIIFFFLLVVNNPLFAKHHSSAFVSLIVLSLVSLCVPVFTAKKPEFDGIENTYELPSISLNGLLSIIASAILFSHWGAVYGNTYFYGLIAIAFVWTYFKKTFDTSIFKIGSILFFVSCVVFGNWIVYHEPKTLFVILFALLLLAIVVYNWTSKLMFKNDFIIRFIGSLGINVMLVGLAYSYLQITHPVLYLFVLMAIALVNYEFLWLTEKRKSLAVNNQTALSVFYFLILSIAVVTFTLSLSQFSIFQKAIVCSGFIATVTYALFEPRWKNKNQGATMPWDIFPLLNSEIALLGVLFFGYLCLQSEYLMVFLGALAIATFFGYKKFYEYKRFDNYSFVLLVASAITSVYFAVKKSGINADYQFYALEIGSVLLAIVYAYFVLKDKNEERNQLIPNLAPYLVNAWIVILLFLQIEFTYLPVLFMIMALANGWLIQTKKIDNGFQAVFGLAILAILFSLYHSLTKLNSFELTDWVTQLGAVSIGVILSFYLQKDKENQQYPSFQIVLNAWLSAIMFSQLEHKWLPVYWAVVAILNLYLYQRKISTNKNTNLVYFLLANAHLAFVSFAFYESQFIGIYLLIFALLGAYIYLGYKWLPDFKTKNSILIYPATLSIACFLYLSFDKGILTLFWILEALGLMILSLLLKEKYFRYISLSVVGICIVRLLFFDLSNSNFLIRALVLLGVGVTLIVMNTLYNKYKNRFE
jgi:hypothetical protein